MVFDRIRSSRRALINGSIVSVLSAFLATSAVAQDLKPFRYTENGSGAVASAGLYIGLEEGIFVEEGLELIHATRNPQSPEALIHLSAGNADVAKGNWLPFLDAVSKGNDFVIVASSFPTSPLSIITLAGNVVDEPADLTGQTLMLQSPSDRQIFEAIMTKAGLPADFETVPTGYTPEPLLQGDGDVYLAFATNQPITLEQLGMVQGEDFYVLPVAALGYNLPGELFITTRSFLDERGDDLVAFFRAMIRGYEANAANPAYGADLTVNKYAADLGGDLTQQTRQNEIITAYRYAEGGRGMFWIDPALIEGIMTEVAEAAGVEVPPAEQIIDLSYLERAIESLE